MPRVWSQASSHPEVEADAEADGDAAPRALADPASPVELCACVRDVAIGLIAQGEEAALDLEPGGFEGFEGGIDLGLWIDERLVIWGDVTVARD
jgi:hypothetical protein